MLKLLAGFMGLGPIAALALGIATSGAIGGLGFWVWSSFVETPHIADLVKAATDRANDACTIRTQAAAAAATADERARQQSVMDAALAAYRGITAAREAARAAAADQLEQEIADNEKRIAAEGRSCSLDPDDILWLRGEPRPVPAAGR